MHSESVLLSWLSTKLNLTANRVEKITEYYPNFNNAIDDNLNQLYTNKIIRKPVNLTNKNQEIEVFKESLNQNNTKILTFKDQNYPQQLINLPDYPPVLFYQGNINLVNQNEMLTVVGSRSVHKYSKQVLESILKPATRLGLGVVSGLAIGIDGLAHQTALETGANTIAVIGSGIDDDSFYPVSNINLKNNIVQSGGLVLSEYAPGVKATNYNFPRRNRILAGLTNMTWVVQAGLKSGTLITANLANEYGKTVATTPANIFNYDYNGNLQLIKDGASIITETQDIFSNLNLYFNTESTKAKQVFEDPIQETIYNQLSMTSQTIDDIAIKSKMKISELTSILTILELEGMATNLGENQWVKN